MVRRTKILSILLPPLVALALLTVAGCRAPRRPYLCDPSGLDGSKASSSRPLRDDERLLAAWRCNLRVVEHAAAGKRFSIRELDGARDFFLGLTGLELSTMPSHLGRLPARGIRADLKQLNSWFKRHRERLVWDDASGEIRLASPSEAD